LSGEKATAAATSTAKSITGYKLTRKKSVRFSDGFAPGKEINDLNLFLTRHYLGNFVIIFCCFMQEFYSGCKNMARQTTHLRF
jgi:hypothetical protein